DIVKIFIDYRLKDYSYYNQLINSIEKKLDNDDIASLYEEAKDLKILLNYIDNSFYKVTIHQLTCLVNAVILYKHEREYNLALSNLISALKLTTHNFTFEDYNTFVYNSLEIRLLMNIAFVLNKLGGNKRYIEILEFCIDILDYNDHLY